MRYFFACVVACFLTVSPAYAISQNIDLEKIDPDVAAQVLKELQKQKTVAPVATITQAKEWASIGEDIAKAVAATAKALSMEVNDFVSTPVGSWAFFLVIWHFIGKTLFSVVLTFVIWAILAGIIWRSFRTFHIPRQLPIKTPEGAITGYETKKYDWKSDQAKVGSVWAHGIAFAVVTLILVVKVL
jgi:hypothetical protein